MIVALSAVLLACLLLSPTPTDANRTVQLSIPANPPSKQAVYPNFLGVSFELSFVDQYFGQDPSLIPAPFVNAFTAVKQRSMGLPLRFRIGGNSMDDSTYNAQQETPMLELKPSPGSSDDQPVNFGPTLFQVLNEAADKIGGASYLLGLSLRDPNNSNVPLLAGAAQQALDKNLDAFLLGNEPDLYSAHGQRPNIQNYTLDDYITDFSIAANNLKNTPQGNVLNHSKLGGPTICCAWDLAAVLQGGFLSNFSSILKYVSTQHYPQDNCGNDGGRYKLPWYMQHANVVSLSSWQGAGMAALSGSTPYGDHSILPLMSEFNSASCGGIPGLSDTFAVGAMWTTDYALQLASVGYSAAFLHTRERGISYNIFVSPNDTNSNEWTIQPPFYSLLVTTEALQSPNGSIVADLNADNSMNNVNTTVAAYGVYDAQRSELRQIVLFNYDTSPSTFTLPVTGANNVQVKYLSAASAYEKNQISWGGETYAGTGDGNMVNNASWAIPNDSVDCTKECNITVAAPGVAVVFFAGTSVLGSSAVTTPSNNTGPSTASESDSTGSSTAPVSTTGSKPTQSSSDSRFESSSAERSSGLGLSFVLMVTLYLGNYI